MDVAVEALAERQLGDDAGERVLLVAVPGAADALVPVLRDAIRAAGGTDLGAVAQQGAQPPAWSTDFTNELAKRTGKVFDEYLLSVDAAVMLPGKTRSQKSAENVRGPFRRFESAD